MTAQLDAPVLDFGRLEEFAGKVAGRPGRGVQRDPRLPRRPPRPVAGAGLATESATAAELAERSGIAPRYVQEWLSAQAANGYVDLRRRDRVLHLLARGRGGARRRGEPGRHDGRVRAHRRGVGGRRQARARLHHRRGHRLARARPAPVQRGRALLRHDVPQLAAHRVAAGRGWSDRAPRVGHPGARRRLRPRRADDPAGRGVPELDLRRRRLPRGVDPPRPRRRRSRPGSPTASSFEVADATSYTGQLRPGAVLRRRPRLRRPGRCAGPRPERARAGRTGRGGRAVRRGHPRGQPRQPDRGGRSTSAARRCASRTASPKGVPRSAPRPDRPGSPPRSARPASPRRGWPSRPRPTWSSRRRADRGRRRALPAGPSGLAGRVRPRPISARPGCSSGRR